MTAKEITRASRRLSLILRHKPESIGLELDGAGWAVVGTLLRQLAAHGTRLSREELERVVRENDKQRFLLSDDGRKIRASQGHSIEVDLGMQPLTPPAILYHGTATRFLDSILASGLDARQRQHVHLSPDPETATTVGRRHGTPVILAVAAAEMEEAGIVFYRSDNGVWLTLKVVPRYLSVHSYPK